MARPQKNNADYFSHDVGMRNDRKIKAVRTKFGISGYAVWCMLLEVLAESDNFVIDFDEVELEMLSGDFDIVSDVLNSMLMYFGRLKMVVIEDGKLYSPKLVERFAPLVAKRDRKRAWQSQNGSDKSSNNHPEQLKSGVSDVQNKEKDNVKPPKESKVKESKVKERKEKDDYVVGSPSPNFEFDLPQGDVTDKMEQKSLQLLRAKYTGYVKNLKGDEIGLENIIRTINHKTGKFLTKNEIFDSMQIFLSHKKEFNQLNHKDYNDFKKNFGYWLPMNLPKKAITQDKPTTYTKPTNLIPLSPALIAKKKAAMKSKRV
jgi:hypothetical protein